MGNINVIIDCWKRNLEYFENKKKSAEINCEFHQTIAKIKCKFYQMIAKIKCKFHQTIAEIN